MNSISAVLDSHSQEDRLKAGSSQMPSDSRSLSSERDYEQLKREFFNNISHELRTPINVLLGSIQLFEMMGDELFLEANRDKFFTYQRIMKQNCYRLLRLVNNLIDVSIMDSGYLSLFPENNNLVLLAQDITQKAMGYAEAKGLTLTFVTEEQEIITACDKEKIQRVLLNLLSNAIKFTPKGGKITVSLYQDEKRVYLSVKDTGIGISEEKLNSIFERFQPEASTLTRNHEGSGIGLSLCSSIIRLHGGLIRVKSIPQQGSEFIIELPNRIIPSVSSTNQGRTELSFSSNERVPIELSDLF
jgi:signal transduction histidine kinase